MSDWSSSAILSLTEYPTGVHAMMYLNLTGNRTVNDYNRSSNKRPQGACYRVAYGRVRAALIATTGTVLPKWRNDDEFCRLWGSILLPLDAWLALPDAHRGDGSAGAMAWRGYGQKLSADAIWSGSLQPGAVVQTWRDAEDHARVKSGDSPQSYGHSFIFLRYAYDGWAISGLHIADQGYQSHLVLTKGFYAYWVAANVCTASDLPFSNPRTARSLQVA